jgi:hypothetical protein
VRPISCLTLQVRLPLAVAATIVSLMSAFGGAPSHAAPIQQGVIHRINTNNVRDTSFVVSWTTDMASTGSVNFGPSSALGFVADDATNPAPTTTHYVVLSGLSPDTTYYFDVASGSLIEDNGGLHYTVRTGPALSGAPGTTIYGRVFQPDGISPLDNAIVYLWVRRAGLDSQQASARTTAGGWWSYNLDNLRTADYQTKFNPTAGETIRVRAQGGSYGTRDFTASVPADSDSISDAILDGIPNAVRMTRLAAHSSGAGGGLLFLGVGLLSIVGLVFWRWKGRNDQNRTQDSGLRATIEVVVDVPGSAACLEDPPACITEGGLLPMKRLRLPLVFMISVLLGVWAVPGVRAGASTQDVSREPSAARVVAPSSPFARSDPAVTMPGYAEAAIVPIQLLAQFGGDAKSVAVRGSTAFVGVGPRLLLYDITDPAHPTLVGQTEPFPSLVINIAVTGDYAYVANWLGGVQIVRIADPAHPVRVATFNAAQAGGEYDVAVAGSYLYVANGAADLHVVDVSDPGHPVEKAALALPGQSFGVTLVGHLAYVAALDAGLQIVDVTDPTHPRVVGSRDTPGSAFHVVVSQNTAYVADNDGGVRIINVADPTQPAEIASVGTGVDMQILDVTVYDHYLYASRSSASNTDARIVAWDVTDPSHPRAVGGTPNVIHLGDAPERITAVGGLIHIAYGAGPWQICRPTPGQVDPVQWISSTFWTRGNSLDASGSHLYINNTDQELAIYDISSPAAPARKYEEGLNLYRQGVPFYGGRFLNLGVHENYVYMLMYFDEVVVINVADPAHPVQAGWYSPRSGQGGQSEAVGLDIAFQDHYAYIAYDWGGLLVLDLTNPAHPTKAALLDTPGKARGVAVAGSYAYVADSEAGLRVIDISNPTRPREVGFYPTTTFLAAKVAAWDHYVGLLQTFSLQGLATSDLLILDVTDPTHPTRVSESSQAPDAGLDLAVDGRYAYIANNLLGVRVMDVGDPTHPAEVAFYDTAGVASAVNAHDSNVYVGDNMGGVYLLHLDAPVHKPRTFLPLVMRPAPPSPLPSAPALNAIDNADGDGAYVVSWSAVASANAYALEEDDNQAFSSPPTQYTMVGTSWNATGKAAGTYYYRVKASNVSGSSAWSNVQLVVVGEIPPDPIVNGNFESGTAGWTEYSWYGVHLIGNSGFPDYVHPHSGDWAAWLGGLPDEISYIQQQVKIPASSSYLSYWHWIDSADYCGYDFGGVVVNSTVVDVYDLCSSTNTGGWVKHVVDLGSYAGETVWIQIRAETDDSGNSNLFVDDVAFESGPGATQEPGTDIDAAESQPKSDWADAQEHGDAPAPQPSERILGIPSGKEQ